jgi:alkylated DNA repair dioxygenase AlkB
VGAVDRARPRAGAPSHVDELRCAEGGSRYDAGPAYSASLARILSYYRSGRDCIGWHADDERDLGDAPTILSLSLGATRDFQFRHREAFPRAGLAARRPELQTVTLPLGSGSLLIMRDPTNKDWKHQLPRRGGSKAALIGARLNLTWRRIVVRHA